MSGEEKGNWFGSRKIVRLMLLAALLILGVLNFGRLCAAARFLWHVMQPLALGAVPSVRLRAAGNGGLKHDVRVLPAQRQHGLGKIHVAADGHAADEAPVPRLIYPVQPGGDLRLQRQTARVVLVQPPRQLHGAVPRKAASHFLFHAQPLPVKRCDPCLQYKLEKGDCQRRNAVLEYYRLQGRVSAHMGAIPDRR